MINSTDGIELSESHIAALKRRRRAFVNFDASWYVDTFVEDLPGSVDEAFGFADDEASHIDGIWWSWGQGKFKDDDTRGDATIKRVEAWLEDVDSTRPQLWWVHFMDPHSPDNCPDPFPQTYVGEVEFTDVQIGELLRHWDARIGLDQTFVVITSDHGQMNLEADPVGQYVKQ